VSANSAEYGGCAFASGAGCNVSVASGSRVFGNNATGISSGNGGAFYLLNASSFIASGGATLEANTAVHDGGGLYAAGVGMVTFARATARSNRRVEPPTVTCPVPPFQKSYIYFVRLTGGAG
jgi:predicted outer membrane repeat protein